MWYEVQHLTHFSTILYLRQRLHMDQIVDINAEDNDQQGHDAYIQRSVMMYLVLRNSENDGWGE